MNKRAHDNSNTCFFYAPFCKKRLCNFSLTVNFTAMFLKFTFIQIQLREVQRVCCCICCTLFRLNTSLMFPNFFLFGLYVFFLFLFLFFHNFVKYNFDFRIFFRIFAQKTHFLHIRTHKYLNLSLRSASDSEVSLQKVFFFIIKQAN